MKIGALLLLLVPLAGSADTYVCQQAGKRIISTEGCESGTQTIKFIASASVPPVRVPSIPPMSDLQRQLATVQRNRAEINARLALNSPSAVSP